MSSAEKSEFVQSLARGLEVIQAFGSDRPALTITEVAARTGLTRAVARRFLLTLVELGHVQTDGKWFRLQPQVLSLGYAYLSSLPWWQVAQPHLEAAAAKLHESCSAAVLDGADIVYVARVPATRIMTINLGIGTRLPAHATSLGRVLLAALNEAELCRYFESTELKAFTKRTVTSESELRRLLAKVAEREYSLVDQELETGLRSLAVPLRDRAGHVVAAINVGTHAARSPKPEMLRHYLPVLKHTAAAIRDDMTR